MTENYLTLLEESLRKKLQVMAEIQKYNLQQQKIFQAEEVDIKMFDEYVEKKGELIERLELLDNGFQHLYEKVAEQLKENRERYAPQIKTLQSLVEEVTESSVTIQAQEARNKKLVQDYFARERERIGQGRRSSKAAYDYYRNMNKSAIVLPQFMDKKK